MLITKPTSTSSDPNCVHVKKYIEASTERRLGLRR